MLNGANETKTRSTHVVLVHGSPRSLAVRQSDLYRDTRIPSELTKEIRRGLNGRCCHRRRQPSAAGVDDLVDECRIRLVPEHEERTSYDLSAARWRLDHVPVGLRGIRRPVAAAAVRAQRLSIRATMCMICASSVWLSRGHYALRIGNLTQGRMVIRVDGAIQSLGPHSANARDMSGQSLGLESARVLRLCPCS